MEEDKEKTVIDTIKLIEDLAEELRQCSRLVDDAEMRRVLDEAEVFLDSAPHPEAQEEDIEHIDEIGLAQWFASKKREFNAQMRLQPFWRANDPIPQSRYLANFMGREIKKLIDEREDAISRLAAPKPEGQDMEALRIAGLLKQIEQMSAPSDMTPHGMEEALKFIHKWAGEALYKPAVPEPRPEAREAIPACTRPDDTECHAHADGLCHNIRPCHPEAREDAYEIGTPREFAERLAWMAVNGKPDLDQWENHIKFRDAAILVSHGQGESWTDPETGLVFYSMTAQEYAAIWNGWEKEKAEIQQGERALRVCGNCLHGRGTSLDDTRCYKATPYLPTGRHCEACADWEPCGTCANPKSAAPLASHDESDTIHNTGSVSHDNREPDGRKGE